MKKIIVFVIILMMVQGLFPACADSMESDVSSTSYTGSIGNETTILMIGLDISADGTQCMFGIGNPGSSLVVLGQLVNNGEDSFTIYPIDGGEMIELTLQDDGEGELSVGMGDDLEGWMNQVTYEEFMELIDMLS